MRATALFIHWLVWTLILMLFAAACAAICAGCGPPCPGCPVDSRSESWLRLYAGEAGCASAQVQHDAPPLICPHCGRPFPWPDWEKRRWRAQADRWDYVTQWLARRRPWPGPKPDELDTPWPVPSEVQGPASAPY